MIFNESHPTSSIDLMQSLQISKKNDYQGMFIRILAGCLDIDSTHNNIILKHRTALNQKILSKGVAKTRLKKFLSIVGEGISEDDLNDYLMQSKKNNNYFKDLCFEVSQALIYTKNNSHLSAFIHYYRTFELICYAFPLLYATRSDSFLGTFNDLKKYFTSDDATDLSFFKKFITAEYKGSLTDLTLDFQLPHDKNLAEKHQKIIATLGKDLTYPSHDIIGIPFLNFGDLFLQLRNRFLHFSRKRHDNISISDLDNTELFFKQINGIFGEWLFMVYIVILEARLK